MAYYKCGSVYTTQNSNVVVDTASGSVANFETDLALPLKSLEIDVNAVQSGSGEPSPDNVRPISSWDNITVSRTGKNLLPRLAETVTSRTVNFTPLSDGKIRINGTAQGGVATCDVGRNIFLLPAGTYYVNETVSTYTITVFKIVGGTATPIKNGGGSFTLTETTSVFVRIAVPQNTTVTNLDVALQLELGSAATTYEPYNGTSVIIPFGDTYYGGVLDVKSGLLTVVGAIYSSTWTQYNQNNGYKAYRSSSKIQAKSYNNAKSNMVANFGTFSSANMNKNIIQLTTNMPNYVYMALDENTDPTDVQIYYELAEPIEVQLTSQQIETLLGTNNIFADTGDTSLQFRKIG